METSRDKEVSEAARLLGKRGGAKGGRAWAASSTPEERQRIARNAVNARWARQQAQRKRRRTMLNVMPIEGPATTNNARNDSTQPRRRRSRPAVPVG